MTTTTFGSVRSEATEQRRFPLAPAEGWTTLGLLLLLCLTLAWSIDDASWVVGPRGLTDYLPLAIVLGVGWGFVSAKVGWSRWLAHLLGATFAALLMPMIVGARLVDGGGPVEWFQATAEGVRQRLPRPHLPGPSVHPETGHFLLVLGLLAWATGQYAGYVTFHHRRPLNAVIVIGVGLVANMSLTTRDQLPYLVIYSLAALFLLIRFHAYDERLLWMRHRIGDAASLGSLYLRGGAVFVGERGRDRPGPHEQRLVRPARVALEGRRPEADRGRPRVPAGVPGRRPDPLQRGGLPGVGLDPRILDDRPDARPRHHRPRQRPLLLAGGRLRQVRRAQLELVEAGRERHGGERGRCSTGPATTRAPSRRARSSSSGSPSSRSIRRRCSRPTPRSGSTSRRS